jgi:DNA-binding MarR family transcriptional regulator
MTGRIDRLEEQGLLKRKPDTVDRRAVRLSLTDQGRVQVNVAFLANLAIYDQILASFDVRDRAELERLLGRLLEGLRATSQASNR